MTGRRGAGRRVTGRRRAGRLSARPAHPVPHAAPDPEEVIAMTVLSEQHLAALAAERRAGAEARNRATRLRTARRLQRRAEEADRRARLAWLAVG